MQIPRRDASTMVLFQASQPSRAVNVRTCEEIRMKVANPDVYRTESEKRVIKIVMPCGAAPPGSTAMTVMII